MNIKKKDIEYIFESPDGNYGKENGGNEGTNEEYEKRRKN